VAQLESAAVSGTAGRPFESGRGRRDATDRTAVPSTDSARSTRAGPALSPMVLMLWMLSVAAQGADVTANHIGAVNCSHSLLFVASLE
jgi:hypothetical protein